MVGDPTGVPWVAESQSFCSTCLMQLSLVINYWKYCRLATQLVKKEKKRKEEKKNGGGEMLFMSCFSAHSNCFSMLRSQAACTGSSETAAYVTGPALEITVGISLLQNTTHLLLDTYTAKQRTFSLVSGDKQEVSHLWCPTSLWKSFASLKIKKNG